MSGRTRSVRLLIAGRVQGVGYRWWCVRQAERLGLDGWVRNRADGTVEAVARGPEDAVDDLIEACRDGPRGAAVESVEVADADAAEAGGGGFTQASTG